MISRGSGLRCARAVPVLLACALASATVASAATVRLINRDNPGEGFNDPTPVAPVGGNPGTTRGEQRLFAFQYAIDIWAAELDSPVEIRVGATFDPLFCDSGFVTLGEAQPVAAFYAFVGAPQPDVLYPSALADRLAGADLDPGNDDIMAQFNSDFGTTCPFPAGWYYGTDGQPPNNDSDFVTVVLHELGHGFGFLTFVDVTTGMRESDQNDPFSDWLVDDRSGKSFPEMTNAERLSAITATGDLKWDGPEVVAASGVLTHGADAEGRVEMYAPADPIVGSSVSHWSDSLTPNELMEPYFTNPIHTIGLAKQAMLDIGWDLPPACAGDCNRDGRVLINELITGVSIALNQTDASVCPAFDTNGDGMVAVNELVAAVNQALNGCGA